MRLKDIPWLGKKITEVYIRCYEAYYTLSGALHSSLKTQGCDAENGSGIISLTAIPERLGRLHICLESLLRQSRKPKKIILWLADTTLETDIPDRVRKCEERGLEIAFCKDIGPHTKYYYSIQRYSDEVIITVDDDMMYSRHWLDDLWQAHTLNNTVIVCHRGYVVTRTTAETTAPYADWTLNTKNGTPSLQVFPTGVNGVLYPPGSLDERVFDEKLIRELCPKADDIWLKAMSFLRGTECMVLAESRSSILRITGTQERTLMADNVDNGQNDVQLKDTCNYFGIRTFE